MSLTYCSDGTGAGTPLIVQKYRIFSSCIFINTKTYAVNDIILVRNTDVWYNSDIDHGAAFAYVCKKNMTSNDVFPIKADASPPPQALATFNNSNEFWQQVSQEDLQNIINSKPPRVGWFYATVVLVILLIFLIINSKPNKKE